LEDKEELENESGNGWLGAFVIILIMIAFVAVSRYYYLKYKILKTTEYTIEHGDVKVELRKVNKNI
jgi:hypothetical protein